MLSTKVLNFYMTSWLVSIALCMVIDGSWFGLHNENSIINSLITMNALNIGGLIGVGAFIVDFFNGILRILLWDYSFYYGGYVVLRYVWLVIFTPAAVWGIGSMFITLFANFLKPL